MTKKVFTNIIILRKTPYKESSLIVSGLSAEYGKIDLLLKGALRANKNKFPIIDLFREIKINYTPNKEKLQAVYSPELVTQSDAIANYPKTFLELSSLALFISNNTMNMVEAPRLYLALQTALHHYRNNTYPKFPWALATQIVYLYENGLLPNYDNNPEEKAFIHAILKAMLRDAPPPEATPQYWEEMKEWLDDWCIYNELQLPKINKNI
jgi:recombinational DNA repair protein (RecF pathway)